MSELDRTVECLQSGNPENPCCGEVEYHSMDPGFEKAWPRCEKHWSERLGARENSMERYAHSDTAPGWFDPTYAGERWDDGDDY